MLPAENDIYGPFGLTILPVIIVICTAVSLYLLWILYRYLRTQLALLRQARLAEHNKPDLEAIIADALTAIDRIRAAVSSAQSDVHQGAADISLLARQTFDTLMNHDTKYLSRKEIELKNLKRVSDTLAISYPIEFSADMNGFDELCQSAKGVILSCR